VHGAYFSLIPVKLCVICMTCAETNLSQWLITQARLIKGRGENDG
jgi:hypothetical protein